MKKVLFISLAVLGIGMAGCSNEGLGVAQKGNDEVTASIGTEESRTAMQENSVVWCANDQIGIFAQTSDEEITHQAYTLSDGVGTKNATFQGYLEGSNPVKKVAYYPYNASATYNNSVVALTLKDNYTYVENENSGAPMACLINESAQGILSFKNAGALMNITVNNIPAGYNKVTLTSNAGSSNGTVPDIAGKAQIAFDTDGVPSLTMVSGESNGKTITISFTAEGSLTSKSFYFPLPVADYPALELAIGDGNDTKVLKTKALDATRNMRYTTTITLDEVSGNVPTEVKSASDASTALASNNSVSIADVSETSPTVTIPEKEVENVSISFDNISTTNAIAIKGADNASSIAKNVLVSAPQLDSAPKFEITLPESTVTLAANGATATYAKVTATTAENTLIVGKGVTVNNLIVKAGNVRIKSGGTVTAISRSSENGKVVKIYVEDGANYPSDLDASTFMVMSAGIADLEAVIKNGGTYKLDSDLDITKAAITIPANKTVTLDLNGHVITADNGAGRITVLGNLTLKDSQGGGKVVANQNYDKVNYGYGLIDVVGENAHLTMESGYIYAVRDNATDNGQFGVALKQGGDFTMTGGKIEAGWFAVSGNGTYNTQNSLIEIKGGELISITDYAVYLPQSGTTTITGGKINGACGGVAINRGALNISGTAEILSTDEGNTGNWSDGTGSMGNAALVVEGKYGDCTVNISGGKFESLKNAALIDNHAATNTQKSITITGGTFSDPTALDYLVENANIDVVLNKDCSIPAFNLTKEGQKVTVDLATHTLTLSDEHQSNISATASFKNGSIKMSNVKHQIWGVGGKLTFDKVHMSGSNYALIVQGPDATLDVINGSKIEANYFPLSTNAGIKDGELTYGANATINLKDSEFIGTETGFMNNVPAVVTMDNCKFFGNHQAALLRGGEYTIKNSIFTLNAELGASYSDNKHLVDWGTGNKAAFAGITIGNYKINAYKYYSKVTMERVIVKVEGTNASSFPAMHVCANSDSEMGVTLTYDTYSTFTSAYSPSIEYGTTNITVNGDAVTEKNGIFTVEEGFSN